jgi:hypothetical protein
LPSSLTHVGEKKPIAESAVVSEHLRALALKNIADLEPHNGDHHLVIHDIMLGHEPGPAGEQYVGRALDLYTVGPFRAPALAKSAYSLTCLLPFAALDRHRDSPLEHGIVGKAAGRKAYKHPGAPGHGGASPDDLVDQFGSSRLKRAGILDEF